MSLFGWLSNKGKITKEQQGAYELGKRVGETLWDDLNSRANGFIDGRFAQFFGDYMDALKQRMDTVYDDPEHDPKLIAQIEFKIFHDNAEEAKIQLHSEFESYMQPIEESYYEALGREEGTVAVIKQAVSEIIDKNLTAGFDLLMRTGAAILDSKIEEIEQRADKP